MRKSKNVKLLIDELIKIRDEKTEEIKIGPIIDFITGTGSCEGERPVTKKEYDEIMQNFMDDDDPEGKFLKKFDDDDIKEMSDREAEETLKRLHKFFNMDGMEAMWKFYRNKYQKKMLRRAMIAGGTLLALGGVGFVAYNLLKSKDDNIDNEDNEDNKVDDSDDGMIDIEDNVVVLDIGDSIVPSIDDGTNDTVVNLY